MSWTQLVDMELDDEDKLDAIQPIPMPSKPDYPYGLRISLTEKELKKLKLPPPKEIGDMIDLRAFGVVTSISSNEVEGGSCCRVEIQLQKIAVESEMQEEMD
jgi:hypothetical protein